MSTIHFSKLSARVHSQHAHVEMVFIKTSKDSPKARLQSLECWANSHWVSVSTPTPFPMFRPEMGGERTLLSEYTSSLPHFHRYGMGPASPSVSYYYGSGGKRSVSLTLVVAGGHAWVATDFKGTIWRDTGQVLFLLHAEMHKLCSGVHLQRQPEPLVTGIKKGTSVCRKLVIIHSTPSSQGCCSWVIWRKVDICITAFALFLTNFQGFVYFLCLGKHSSRMRLAFYVHFNEVKSHLEQF